MHDNNKIILPFLKWAGGKRWLVKSQADIFPKKYNRYIEPFVGSGAVYFHLQPKKAILSDKNEQLIEVYQSIKDEWQKIEAHLKRHHYNHNKEYYYKIRSQKMRTSATRSAQFIYLNRTCWNGLYRVNLNGEFNVPIGTKKNVILDTDDFEKVSKLLEDVDLISSDFDVVLRKARAGDLVFVDPPYTVRHNYNGFVKYNKALFSWDDQIRLRDSVNDAVSRGAKILVTNAYHDSVKKLYKGMGKIIKLNRSSVISGDRNARGRFEEMVIKCY